MKQDATESAAHAGTERPSIGGGVPPMFPAFAPEEGLRRLAWDLFDWAEDPPLSLSATEQQALARQLLAAADVISTLRAERDEARGAVLAAPARLNAAYNAWLREVDETRAKEGW